MQLPGLSSRADAKVRRSMTPSEVEQWPKKCGCGIVYDRAAWVKLLHVGDMVDEVEAIQLRNCTCGSTIAIILDEKEGEPR